MAYISNVMQYHIPTTQNMSSKHISNRLLPCLAIAVMVFVGVTKADIEKDKQQCADKLVGLAACLPYVSGQTPAPPKDCCTGLKQVVTNSPECFCILVKDHNDPSLNLKINDTLALSLPESCQTSANISDCVRLLHLKPGSPDAKVFDDYAKGIKSNTTTMVQPGNATTTTNSTSSDGERIHISLGHNIVGLIIIMVFLHFHVPNEIGNHQR